VDNRFGSGQLERDYADFTYPDVEGNLGQYIAQRSPGYPAPSGDREITYHLEVKTTLGRLDTRVMLSNNQIRMAKRHSLHFLPNSFVHTDTYVLVRVYDLCLDRDGRKPKPKVRFFVDPWYLICRNALEIEGEAGIYTRPLSRSTSEGTGGADPSSFASISSTDLSAEPTTPNHGGLSTENCPTETTQCPSTLLTDYVPTPEVQAEQDLLYHNITMQSPYEKFSVEELRLADYKRGLMVNDDFGADL
jgi:hypothetical protein